MCLTVPLCNWFIDLGCHSQEMLERLQDRAKITFAQFQSCLGLQPMIDQSEFPDEVAILSGHSFIYNPASSQSSASTSATRPSESPQLMPMDIQVRVMTPSYLGMDQPYQDPYSQQPYIIVRTPHSNCWDPDINGFLFPGSRSWTSSTRLWTLRSLFNGLDLGVMRDLVSEIPFRLLTFYFL